jgi:hypothetical protein
MSFNLDSLKRQMASAVDSSPRKFPGVSFALQSTRLTMVTMGNPSAVAAWLADVQADRDRAAPNVDDAALLSFAEPFFDTSPPTRRFLEATFPTVTGFPASGASPEAAFKRFFAKIVAGCTERAGRLVEHFTLGDAKEAFSLAAEAFMPSATSSTALYTSDFVDGISMVQAAIRFMGQIETIGPALLAQDATTSAAPLPLSALAFSAVEAKMPTCWAFHFQNPPNGAPPPAKTIANLDVYLSELATWDHDRFIWFMKASGWLPGADVSLGPAPVEAPARKPPRARDPGPQPEPPASAQDPAPAPRVKTRRDAMPTLSRDQVDFARARMTLRNCIACNLPYMPEHVCAAPVDPALAQLRSDVGHYVRAKAWGRLCVSHGFPAYSGSPKYPATTPASTPPAAPAATPPPAPAPAPEPLVVPSRVKPPTTV